MPRLIASTFAATLAFTGGAAAAETQVTADPACKVVRILPNGKRIVTPPSRAYRSSHGPAYAAASSSSGGGASSSSVSVSSSSGGRGHAAASSSTSSGRRGQTVTTTHDENGCTVVIDRRRGARR